VKQRHVVASREELRDDERTDESGPAQHEHSAHLR
jgi:hypothetical protein